MPRLMSVALTEPQVRARTKYRTRRLGWRFLRPGDRLTLCRKVMGRKGEPLVRICDVEVTDVRRCQLAVHWDDDPAAEGFPDWTYDEFVEFFCQHMKATPETVVTVIDWRYLDDEEA